MAATTADLRHRRRALDSFHAVILAGMHPLFLGALLTDIAYAKTHHIQWQNFGSWLITGGLVFCGIALVCALVGLFRGWRDGRGILYVLLVVATFVVGVFNALAHAKDAWAMLPEGVVLSAIVLVLALLATWIGFASWRTGGDA